MFYQHNPYRPSWGTIHWGHAVSRDLVYWDRLPLALAPSPGGPDSDGCFSGCAVDHHGVPTIIYTGVFPETQCIATSDDDLVTLKKYPGNPVIAKPPPGFDLVGFRDPCVWQQKDIWYMALGSGINDVGGAILLYRSQNLVNWEFLHPLLIGDKNAVEPIYTGTMWECPQFFPLGGDWILVISACLPGNNLYTLYYTGKFENLRFYPQALYKLDHGDSIFYAPQVFRNQEGQYILLGWIQERRSDHAQQVAGWSGVMSLPRLLSRCADGRLGMQPWGEFVKLRGPHQSFRDIVLDADKEIRIAGLDGSTLEVQLEVEVPGSGGFDLQLCTTTADEKVLMAYHSADQMLSVDTTCASLSSDSLGEIKKCPISLLPGETLNLHIFVDKSVLEVFGNGWVSLTGRMYPTQPVRLDQSLLLRSGGPIRIKVLDLWELKGIW